jgi:hypothetical protein
MRIRVPGRVIVSSAALTAFLCLLPASSHVANARPIGWEDVGPPDPAPPGDNDGVVLKSGPLGGLRPAGRIAVPISTSSRYASTLRLFFAVTRLNTWYFWVR